MRPLIHLLQAGFLGVWSAVWIVAALLLRLVSGSAELPLAMARRIWAPPLFWAAGVKLEVRGAERVGFDRGVLLASNHQSILDIPALFVAVPVGLRFVGRSALRKIPFLGWYMASMGMVFVDRSRSLRAADAVDHAVRLLSAGECLLTFPEGTRSSDGGVGPFRGAPLAPAIKSGLPVVPVAVDGAFEVLPRGPFRPRPGRIRVTFGEPLATDELTLVDRHALALEVRERVLTLKKDSFDQSIDS